MQISPAKKYLVLDLETSGTKTFKRFCNPLDPRHLITVLAVKKQGEEAKLFTGEDYKAGLPRQQLFSHISLDDISVICGQNLKFDLLYVWENKDFQNWLESGGRVWDTQTVEYLLNGQDRTKRDLDTLALRYGGEVKDDRLKVLFKEGIQCKDIDPEILLPYAKEDVINTNLVVQGQIKRAKETGMLPLIRLYMEHYLAIIEMEYNGLHVNMSLAKQKQKELEKETNQLRESLIDMAMPLWPLGLPFSPTSTHHVSALLFGGSTSTMEDMPVLDEEGAKTVYKSGKKEGQTRTKKTKVEYPIKGYRAPRGLSTKGKNGNFSTEDKVLEALKKFDSFAGSRFVKTLLIYREKFKLLTTYYYSVEYYKNTNEIKKITGLLPLVFPKTGAIHSEFQTAYTRTGRLASRNPNVQNLPLEFVEIFNSRFKDGFTLEFDYSQLEVRVQAYLAQSYQMIQDIKNNVDFHCKRLAYAEGLPYDKVAELCKHSAEWKEKRKNAKTISFQKAYGAQPAKIAESSGLPLQTVEKVFKEEDKAYPEIKEFYKKIQEYLKKTRRCSTELINIKDKRTQTVITREGEYKASATYTSINHKVYTFEEKAVLTKHNRVFRYFLLPEIQDYPVQGLAADIVASQVGKVFRFLLEHRDKAVMVNEVHDSLVLDVKKEHLDWTILKVCAILENVNETFQNEFGLDFNVPIKVDYAFGRTWKDAK